MKKIFFLFSVSFIVVLLLSFIVVPDWSNRGIVDDFFVGVTFSGTVWSG